MSAPSAAEKQTKKPAEAVSRELVPYTPPAPASFGDRIQAAIGSPWFRSAFVGAAVAAGWFAGAVANRPDQAQVALFSQQFERIAALSTELASVRADVDQARTLAQTSSGAVENAARSVENVQRAVASSLIQVSGAIDRMDTERSADRTRLTERIDRLERQTSAMTPTATIAPAPVGPKQQLPVPSKPDASAAGKESSVVPMTPPGAAKTDIPIRGYVLRGVADGMALVVGRFGLREVGPGQTIPGAGRVQSIAKRGRKWVVITTAGLIDEEPYR